MYKTPCKFLVGLSSRLGGREHLISTQGVMRSTLASGRRGIDRGQGDAVFCRYGPGSFLSNLHRPRTPMESWMSPAVRRVQGMLHGSREAEPSRTDRREIRSEE